MKEIRIADYDYELPAERIADFPLSERDQSKLLVYDGGVITHRSFKELHELLPESSSLFFNDSKVIPARILFTKETGSTIEILLLRPADGTLLHHHAMAKTGSVKWICTIGNLKKWTAGIILERASGDLKLSAELSDRDRNIVTLSWEPKMLTFAEVLSHFGATPLPPYIKREVQDNDRERYQTVYSKFEGAVAAPTAGLHFTPQVLSQIKARQIPIDFITLHVSAGTFQPVKTENAVDHEMHSEQVIVSRQNIENLMHSKKEIIAVGTTSMRILESLYWYGVKIIFGKGTDFKIEKLEPYSYSEPLPTRSQAFYAILNHMKSQSLANIAGNTAIYIIPGYQFRVVEGMITNFHQPRSTLMLLVAAFVGEDWREIYREALQNGYRFLSYGDSSLLRPKKKVPAQ